MEAGMDNSESKQAALAVWRAFSTRDADQIKAVLTEDAEWLAPAGNATAVALGGSAHMVGAVAIADFIAKDFGRLFVRDVAIAVTGVFAAGNVVVFEQKFSATLVNGREYDNLYCFVFEMVGGRARRIREYMDTSRGFAMMFGAQAPRQLV
jgi:ketosteroid isomerase-like protein